MDTPVLSEVIEPEVDTQQPESKALVPIESSGRLSKGRRAPGKATDYRPKIEREEHKLWYSYYLQLGKGRSIPKVAQHFGKSIKLVSLVSSTFKWTNRIEQYTNLILDPVVQDTRVNVDNTRKKLVFVVEEIMESLHGLAEVSKQIRTGAMTPENGKVVLERLKTAVGAFGFKWSGARDFRDLIGALKEVVKFNDVEKAAAAPQAPKVNIGKVQLLIKE